MKRKNIIQNNGYEKNTKALLRYAALEEKDLFFELNTSKQGLNFEDVEALLDFHGKNIITHEKPDTWYKQIIRSFINPFIIVLLCLAMVSFFIDYLWVEEDKSLTTVIVIVSMVLISGILHFIQEYRSTLSIEKLKSMVTTTASVKRDNSVFTEIPIEEIVSGDIIHLSAGDMVPADVRIISSKDLFIRQSSLTGESEPVEKYDKIPEKIGNNPLELNNLCFMGTNVVSGVAIAIVLHTGNRTYFGSMAKSLTGKADQTSFDKGVNSVSYLLIRFMLVMVPIVLFINGFTKGDWFQAVLFALSVAVGLTPEMLPMIVTTNLAKGAVTMARKKTIVKRLNSIQSFGAMDILCTDKTGTLTEDKIVLERYLDIHGNEDERILRHAYLNAYFQTGLKNLMDLAILNHGKDVGFKEIETRYTKIDEIPFDFQRRRMSVAVRDNNGKTQMVTKGAIEEMLSASSFAEYKGEIVELTEEIKNKIIKTTESLNAQGLRVIAVAQKNNPPGEGVLSVADEKDMVLIGYIGFLDPPKKATKAAIEALNDYGVKVKILTGDNDAVAKCICSQVGLDTRNIILGSNVEEMSDEDLANVAEETTLFAKLSPLQKSRVVKALQSKDHVVGFLGDGINDAAAMRQSDVGISVDNAVDIAKESADIILLEKDLMVLEQGVIEGRKIFGNIIKYIKMTASSNFGNIFSILAASAFLPFLPMLPIQILVLNLIYDISQISIPWDNMDDEYLRYPRKWDASGIGRFMIWFGPISSIFDITTYLIMYFIFGGYLKTPEAIALFHTGWFIESLFTQVLIIHFIRTEKTPFIKSRASLPVSIGTILALLVGMIIPYTAFGRGINLTILPLSYYPWLIVTILLYGALIQFLKRIYIRKYNALL